MTERKYTFLSDVLVAVASLDLKVPNNGTKKRDVRAELLFWSLNLLFYEVAVVVVDLVVA